MTTLLAALLIFIVVGELYTALVREPAQQILRALRERRAGRSWTCPTCENRFTIRLLGAPNPAILRGLAEQHNRIEHATPIPVSKENPS